MGLQTGLSPAESGTMQGQLPGDLELVSEPLLTCRVKVTKTSLQSEFCILTKLCETFLLE